MDARPSPPDEEAPARADAAAEVARAVSYVVLLIAALGFYIVAGDLPSSKWEPLGAGAFPKLVLGLLAALCLAAIVLSLRRLASLGLPGGWGARCRAWVIRHRLVLLVFVAFGVYLFALRGLGFVIATFCFLLVAQLVVARRTPRAMLTALAVAIVFSFGLNWLFAEVFLVFLPRGLLG